MNIIFSIWLRYGAAQFCSLRSIDFWQGEKRERTDGGRKKLSCWRWDTLSHWILKSGAPSAWIAIWFRVENPHAACFGGTRMFSATVNVELDLQRWRSSAQRDVMWAQVFAARHHRFQQLTHGRVCLGWGWRGLHAFPFTILLLHWICLLFSLIDWLTYELL